MKPTKKQLMWFEELNHKFKPSKIEIGSFEHDWEPLLSKQLLNMKYGSPLMFEIYDTVYHKGFGVGTVIEIDGDEIFVDFDEYNPNLHNLKGKCADGHGLVVPYFHLVKVE